MEDEQKYTKIWFRVSINDPQDLVKFPGEVTDEYIDNYFELSCGGVAKWWREDPLNEVSPTIEVKDRNSHKKLAITFPGPEGVKVEMEIYNEGTIRVNSGFANLFITPHAGNEFDIIIKEN